MTRLSLHRSAALPRAPFTTAQATAIGLSDRDLRNLMSTRVIRRVLTGVYAPSDLPNTMELRMAALALVTSPFMVVCDRTAAWAWGIDVYCYVELEILPPLETRSMRGNARVRRKGSWAEAVTLPRATSSSSTGSASPHRCVPHSILPVAWDDETRSPPSTRSCVRTR